MKHKHYIFSVLAIILFFTLPQTIWAQTEEDQFELDEPSFVDKLWFGGGFTLGFAGNQDVKEFVIGVSPMVGYKFTDRISVGPRVGGTYVNRRIRNYTGGANSDNWIKYEAGLFGRFKVTEMIFVHGEYEQVWVNALNQNISNQEQNTYLGLGYTTGGFKRGGGEIMVLWNLSVRSTEFRSPILVRAGFNYNF